jgi:hypothetical protein
MKKYFYILSFFISSISIAPVSGFCFSLPNSGDNLYNANSSVDTLGPILGENPNFFCVVDNDCASTRCDLTKEVYKNIQTNCENNLQVTWKIDIDLYQDGITDYEYISDLTIGNDVSNANNGIYEDIVDDNGNGIKDIYLAPTIYGNYCKIYLPQNDLPNKSTHLITWTATDICGNRSVDTEIITVKDLKKPTPICIPLATGVAYDYDGNGPLMPYLELYAVDFMFQSYDNCTADADLFFTFDNVPPQLTDKVVFGKIVNKHIAHYFNSDGALSAYPAISDEEKEIENRYLNGEQGIYIWFPQAKSSVKLFNCNALDPINEGNSIDLMLTVWDEEIYHDFCWSRLNLIISCDFFEDRNSDIIGNVSSVTGAKAKNILIHVDSNLPEFPKSQLTNQEGKYQFSDFPKGLNYKMEGTFVSEEMKGLDYTDMSNLYWHLQGIKLITNPYQLIAADVNGDLLVNELDFIMLKNALQTKSETGFTANKCVVKSSELNVSNWNSYKESIDHTLADDVFDLDFVAIKIGDINGSHFGTGNINYEYKKTYIIDPSHEVDDRSNDNQDVNQVSFNPNPFADYTTLSFFAPQAGDYTLLITDLAGKIVSQQQFKAIEGSNIQLINSEQLGASGTYICTLKSTDMIVNKKLVLVR